MEKVVFEVALDRDIAAAARKVGLDVPGEAERAVKRRLSMAPEEVSRVREEIRAAVEQYNSFVEEHGSFSDEWRRF